MYWGAKLSTDFTFLYINVIYILNNCTFLKDFKNIYIILLNKKYLRFLIALKEFIITALLLCMINIICLENNGHR